MSEADAITEITIWKRYNDFKELYKGMANLHKALHRRNPFPVFAKPKLFGRFEEAVIEERRKSATDLLVFIGSQPHLYNSKIFEEFLKDGKVKEGISGKVLKPSKLDILQSISPQTENESKQPVKHPPDKAQEEKEVSQNGESTDELEGVWNFPQVPDNISLNSFDDTDESEAIDADSMLSTSLPELDLTSFDPLKSEDQGPPTPGLKASSSWLFQAMDTCAGIENETAQNEDNINDADDKPLTLNLDQQVPIDVPSWEAQQDVSEFDPMRSGSSTGSGVICGKGDLDLSWHSRKSSTSSRTSSVTSSPKHLSKRSPSHRFRSGTNESVSTMDLGGKEDYIYNAADQICLAQEYEASAKYDLAFSYYKSGVGILLQGVQSDKNKARRDAVRRKTAQYLMKAEDLYNRHLANDTIDDMRWSTNDNVLSPAGDLDPTLTFIKAPVSEMKKLKVLGTIDKVLLVMDKTTDQTYVIKTIHKSSVCSKYHRTIMPLSCPYMVNLHKFYETDHAIYLQLQHAMGGQLWNYIGEYLQCNKGNSSLNVDDIPTLSTNVYSGCHMSSNSKDFRLDIGKRTDSTINNVQTPVEDYNDQQNSISSNNLSNQFEENKLPDTVSDISDLSDDNDKSDSNDKVDYNRMRSLSSEENTDIVDVLDFVENKDTDVFQEILHSNRATLENFSINSIDSTEGRPRVDSVISDNINIESIPEENEVSPTHQPYTSISDTHPVPMDTTDEVIGHIDFERSDSKGSNVDMEAEAIVQNAKDLLKTVERTLSQTDSDVNKCIYPDSVENNKSVLNDSTDTLEEVSIYDINRSSSDTNSESESKPCDQSKNRTKTVQSSSSETLSDKTGSRKTSRSSTLTDQVKPRPLKLSRMNSKELSRSASFERDLKSPHRQRSISDVFRQLDLALSNPEQVKLPETCVKQWMAEIIIAVSRLHAEGIICRDLCPDNILLGENGHILLSYFCQISLTDNILNEAAEDQLYVAPEVNGIGNYTEVCDWWSVGTLLYELVTLRIKDGYLKLGKSWLYPTQADVPSSKTSFRSLKSCHPGGITRHTQLHLPANVSPEVDSLLHQLLCFNPKERLGSGINGCEDIKAHPFFSSINWNQLENPGS